MNEAPYAPFVEVPGEAAIRAEAHREARRRLGRLLRRPFRSPAAAA